MENIPEAAHCGVADEDIFRRMQENSQGDLILDEDDGPYEKGDILRSFHHQARPTSRKALLAGFLTVWLKRCVVPFSSGDVIHPTVLLPSSSPWSFPWTPSSHGVLYSERPSRIDRGFL